MPKKTNDPLKPNQRNTYKDYLNRAEKQASLVNAFYTEDEKKRRDELFSHLSSILVKEKEAREAQESEANQGEEKKSEHTIFMSAINEKDIERIEKEIDKLEETVEERYANHFNGDGQAILADVKFIFDLVIPEDFKDFGNGLLRQVRDLTRKGKDSSKIEELSRPTEKNCAFYLYSKIRVQDQAINKLENPEPIREELDEILSKKVADILSVLESLPEDPKEDTPTLISLRPKYHTMLNHNLINELTNPEGVIANEPFDLTVRRESGRQPALTDYVMIEYAENGEKPENYKLDEVSQLVQNAIVSLCQEAERRCIPDLIINEDLVAKAMPGGATRISDAKREEIQKAVEKLRSTRMTVVAPAEIIVDGSEPEEATWTLNNYLLSALELTVTVKNGGRRVHGWKLLSEPLLYTYGKKTGQITSVPRFYMDVKKLDKHGNVTTVTLPMTTKRQVITEYLLRRIAVMKRDAKQAKILKQKDDSKKLKAHKEDQEKPQETFRKAEQTRSILFETLFSAVGLENQTKDDAMNNRNFITDVLNYEVAVKFIKGYEMVKENRRFTKIQIFLEEDEPAEKKQIGNGTSN